MKGPVRVRRKEYPRRSKHNDPALTNYWRRLVRQIVIKYHLKNTRDLEQFLQANGYAEHVPMRSVGPYLQWLINNDAEVRAALYIHVEPWPRQTEGQHMLALCRFRP
jgi:hypothetical protein